MVRLCRLCVLTAAALLGSTAATAQLSAVAKTLSPAEVADSQSTLTALQARVRAEPRNAAEWFHLGNVAWVLTTRARAANPPRELDATRLGKVADQALRMACELSPDSALYFRHLGLFLLESGAPTARHEAVGVFDKGAAAARKTGTVAARTLAFLEAGLAHWRRYDNYTNRRYETVPGATFRSFSDGAQVGQKAAMASGQPAPPVLSMKAVITNWLAGTAPISDDVNGAEHYRLAGEYFREAYDVTPNNPRVFRSLAMVFAEKNRWVELETLARRHLAQFPSDPDAFMSLGLARHRLGNSVAAEVAFDSALAAMSTAERARIDRMTRIRPPTMDTTILVRGTPAEREAMRRVYWMLANPLWSESANLPRVEYFARTAFAELRWTVDEANVKGADTDRGNVFIRYGPANTIGVMHPAMRDPADTENGTDLTTVWIYKSGLMFVFKGALSFATAETAPEDRRLVTEIYNINPVRWDNIAIPAFDSIATQVARFRAGGDSVDVVVAAAPDVSAIRGPVANAPPVHARAWWVAPNSSIAFKDSSTLTSNAVVAWSHRFKRGGYVLRTEATAEQSQTAGRTTLVVDAGGTAAAFPATGFGISDLLIASSASNAGRAGARWKDLAPNAVADAVGTNASIALVWENYEFGAKDGTAQYDVVVTLTRARSLGGRISAAVIGALASAARVDRRSDRVTITINRTMPHAPAFADQVSVSLQDTPPGEYELDLKVTDKVSGKSAGVSRRFVISPSASR